MAYPKPVSEQPLIPPASRPLLALGLLRDAAGSSRNYTSGSAAGALLRYTGLDSFAWWVDPDLSAPVRVHLSESLTGVFADAQIEVTHLPVDAATVELGDLRSIDSDLQATAWYTWRVASRTDSGGLVTLTGETILARLARTHPREAFTIVAGEGGVPTPLTLQECLRRFLVFYGVPHDPAQIPPFMLRTGDDVFAPTVDAFVIQPNQESPESILDWLDRFFAPFRGYAFRADAADQLVVTSPAWLDTLGLRLRAYRTMYGGLLLIRRYTVSAPWGRVDAPLVTWAATVQGIPSSGAFPSALVQGTPQDVTTGGLTFRATWTSGDEITINLQPLPPYVEFPVPTIMFDFTATILPDVPVGDELELLPVDLAPDAMVSIDAERVVNQAIVKVQALAWQTAQAIMEPAAVVVRSPVQAMAGAFGSDMPYGPMSDDLATPGSFLELVNAAVQVGTWFWPVAASVVIQPGGLVNVAYSVDEWAEEWRGPSAPYAAAASVNTFSGSANLPANGDEVELFKFQFPRRTTDFAPSPYGARGTVYGRWRPGADPGIEVRIGNSRFAEFGFLPALGPLGETTYFLWGAIVTLNGTGTTFTTGATSTHRFGYSQDGDLWEGGAEVPALVESQTAYPSRSLEVTLPYPLTEAQALAVARGIVEENLHPRATHQLTLVPNTTTGWPLTPADLGRVVNVPSIGVRGRLISIDYDEAHTPGASQTTVSVELEELGRIPNSTAGVTTYAAATYSRSIYQKED